MIDVCVNSLFKNQTVLSIVINNGEIECLFFGNFTLGSNLTRGGGGIRNPLTTSSRSALAAIMTIKALFNVFKKKSFIHIVFLLNYTKKKCCILPHLCCKWKWRNEAMKSAIQRTLLWEKTISTQHGSSVVSHVSFALIKIRHVASGGGGEGAGGQPTSHFFFEREIFSRSNLYIEKGILMKWHPPPRIRILMICELKLGFIVDFVYLLVKIQGSFAPPPFSPSKTMLRAW